MSGTISANTVQLRQASAADAPLLHALLQFYIYDFSEFEEAGSDKLSFDANGHFRVTISLDAYWNDPQRWAYVILESGNPAGFALVNTHSHVGQAIDRNMAEFFVARKYRRRSVATTAFHQMLHLHPGKWEVAVIEPNRGAQRFWPRAIDNASNTSEVSRLDHSGEAWTGPVWTFIAAAPHGQGRT